MPDLSIGVAFKPANRGRSGGQVGGGGVVTLGLVAVRSARSKRSWGQCRLT